MVFQSSEKCIYYLLEFQDVKPGIGSKNGSGLAKTNECYLINWTKCLRVIYLDEWIQSKKMRLSVLSGRRPESMSPESVFHDFSLYVILIGSRMFLSLRKYRWGFSPKSKGVSPSFLPSPFQYPANVLYFLQASVSITSVFPKFYSFRNSVRTLWWR